MSRVRYLQILLNGNNQLNAFMDNYSKYILYKYRIYNSNYILVITRRFAPSKKIVFEMLSKCYIFPVAVGNTNVENPQDIFNSAHQYCTKIVKNNVFKNCKK